MSRSSLPLLLAAALALPAAAAGKDTDKDKKGQAEVKKRRDRDPGGDRGCAGPGDTGVIQGPVASSFFEADFATGRRACPRTEMGLGVQGGAAIDLANFYGQLGGHALVFGSYALKDDLELFGALEAVRVQYLINASLSGVTVTLGQATVGATWSVLRRGPLVLGPSARVMLPTSFATPNVRQVGAELGAAAGYRVLPQLDLHGYLGGDFSAGLSAGPALPRFGLLLSAGGQYAFLPWLSVVLDLNAHAGSYAYVAPALAVRATLGKVVGLELGGTLPVLGSLRSNAAGGLKVSYRFDAD